MRILAVRFKNLNSLTGEWYVDFTHPAYASDGIFAITGPTGAGKTTILDAICLGLYGRTPRLDRVTKSGNEIMSRQTGECFSEVTFETQVGRFRCHWSQHRARKQPEGELQQARHEIADADSGAVLESKIAQVGAFIERVTGMDYDRFTRSMLLAQGGFTAFLQASPDGRAPILEQITGTEIYSQISIKVHERRNAERDKLDLLQAELKGIRLLTDEERMEQQKDLQERKTREAEISGRVETLRKAALWLERVAVLEKEIGNLDKEYEDAEAGTRAFEPEAKKLERSRRALALEADYRGVAALRAQQQGETKELEAVLASLPEKERACANALAAKEAAEKGLKEARARQQSEGDIIKKVRDLDVRLAGQKKQIIEKDEAAGNAEKQGEDYKKELGTLERSLKDARAGLEAIHHFQVQHAADEGLVTHFAAIERGFKALGDLEARHVKAQERAGAAALKRSSALKECEKLEANYQKHRRRLEEKQHEVKVLASEVASLLKGRDIGEWRELADTLREREDLLKETSGIIDRLGKTSAAREALVAGLEALKAGHGKLTDEIKAFTGKKGLLEKDVENLETKVSLLDRIRSLEDERKRLVDGHPCPLCGAPDHPYAQGNVPELGDAERALGTARAELKKVSETLGRLEREQVKTITQIGHAEEEIREKTAAREEDEKRLTDRLGRLGIEGAADEWAGKVQKELEANQAKITEVSGIIAAAEEKAGKEKAARMALENFRVRLDEAGIALENARIEKKTADIGYEQAVKEAEDLAQEIRENRNAALEDVRPFGVTGLTPANLNTVLKDLAARKNVWQVRADKKIAYEKEVADLKAKMEKSLALLGKLETDLAGIRKERENLKAGYESLSAARRWLFGEKDADSEEKRLAGMVNQAEEAQEAARAAYGRTEKEISSLKEKIATLKERTENRAKELARSEQELMERIRKAGFEDEADYHASCLSAEERKILEDKENSLTRKKTELEARRKDRSEALAAEREKGLADRPIDSLRTELAGCESALKELQEGIGAIKNRLSENEKLREKQQQHLEIVDAQKKECARWDELHQLIGSADGKKFRNFAQGLTFEIMVAHANRQLLKMTDRYMLTRDIDDPLELNVIDNYQAGEIRSTKNLSGGESFIVSLSLALGLSQMASRNVRVDSLFLDEGFGTLDEDALETALETLGSLQQDGKLIGVISHVPALKERIGTQIQVIPQTGGRSIIEGPGCSARRGTSAGLT